MIPRSSSHNENESADDISGSTTNTGGGSIDFIAASANLNVSDVEPSMEYSELMDDNDEVSSSSIVS